MFDLFRQELEIDPNFSWDKSFKAHRQDFIKMAHTADLNIYFIQSGCVRVGFEEEDKTYTVRFGYSGSFITSLQSYFSEQPCRYFIQVLRKAEVKSIHKHHFMRVISGNAILYQHWTKLLEGLIISQLEREEDLLTNSPERRLNRLLNRSPQVFQEAPHKYIADYLRMSPETLSRLLAKS
jgi:CRP-like cAMP-binding protein